MSASSTTGEVAGASVTSSGCQSDCFMRARSSSTATFSGEPGRPWASNGGFGMRLSKVEYNIRVFAGSQYRFAVDRQSVSDNELLLARAA